MASEIRTALNIPGPLGPRRRRRRRRSPVLAAAVLAAVLPFAGLGFLQFWPEYAPVPPVTRLVIGDHLCSDAPLFDGAGRLLISLETVEAHLDPSVTWDPEVRRATVSTAGKTIRMATDSLTEFVNRVPVDLNVPVTLDPQGRPYVPGDFFLELLGLVQRHVVESNTVIIDRVGELVPTGVVGSSPVYVREAPSLFSLRLSRLEPGDKVRLSGEEGGWYRVRDASGWIGYVPKKSLTPGEPFAVAPADPGPPSPPLTGPVFLVWEHVHSRNPDPGLIGPMPGLNVVSPTWFHVVDNEGTVQNLADTAYVAWARQRGYQVWGLVTNGFNRDRTRAVLTDPAKREKIVRQLLIYSSLYRLDGLNMDFENMYLAQKADYVRLMRELSPLAREQGLVLSVDVTFYSSSEAWSLCYDRRALAEAVDYVMAMGYDQHTAGSPVSGPVGAIPWVEAGIQRILSEVPASKLVLGVPFYTRLWAEQSGQRPTVKTLWMQDVLDIIAEKGLTPTWDAATGHNYISYVEDGVRYRVWIEDEASMALRVELVRKYSLAGVAAWRRGFELPYIWEVIERGLSAMAGGEP